MTNIQMKAPRGSSFLIKILKCTIQMKATARSTLIMGYFWEEKQLIPE